MGTSLTSLCRAKDISDLNNSTEFTKLSLHSDFSKLQTMVIHMPPNFTYEFIVMTLMGIFVLQF